MTRLRNPSRKSAEAESRWLPRPKSRPAPAVPDTQAPSPEDDAGFWNSLFFSWMSSLLAVGFRRPLESNDIYLVPSSRAADHTVPQVVNEFQECIQQGRRYPLAKALYASSKTDFWIGAGCQLLESTMQALAPFTLRFLITYARDARAFREGTRPDPPVISHAIGVVVGITAMQVTQSIASSHYHYRSRLMGAQARSVLSAMALDKSLKLSSRARIEWPNGMLTGMISTDLSRIDQACGTLHLVWASPIAILLTVALLLVNLGYSALAGVAVLVLGLAALTKVVGFTARRSAEVTPLTDKRAGLTHEIIRGIRFLKYFGWEDAYLSRLKTVRAAEVRSVKLLHITKSAIGAVSMALPIFSSMAAFVVFARVRPASLEPAAVFSSLALFNSLRTPMNWLPVSIGHLIDATVALKRVQDLLLAEEAAPRPEPQPELEHAIQLDEASFTWEGAKDADEPAFALSPLSISFGRTELVAIVGSVGSGKSSLLSAIAGQMRQTGGHIRLGAKTAYSPQASWLQHASVLSNITSFGGGYDEQRYRQVVAACALQPDFAALPAGDATEIGERGTTLSGGQKARVGLARVLYSDAGVLLLDDPLSAVDAHVGEHIFTEAILGWARGRCCLLATHQLHILNRCDRIVWMCDGRVAACGSLAELLNSHPDFVGFLTGAGAMAGQREKDETTAEVKLADPETDEQKAKEEYSGAGGSLGLPASKLMQEDVRAVNSVPWSTYIAWMRSSGSLFGMVLVVVLVCVFRAANYLTSLSLAWWVSDMYSLSTEQYIGLYAGLGVAQGVLLFTFSVASCLAGIRASHSMSNTALWQVLRAPMLFFETTPLGRILYRFTKDVDTMDNNLTDSLRQYLIVLSSLLGAFGLIMAYFHYFAIALVIVSTVLVSSVVYYRRSARELKRHHAVLDGAVLASFSESLSGAATIRAFSCEAHYLTRLKNALDTTNAAFMLNLAAHRWLSIRLDNMGNALSLTTGVLVLASAFSVPPAITGLILSYSLSLVGIIQITVRYLADVDAAMSSTERLHQYATSLPSEAPLETPPGTLQPGWPASGALAFQDVSVRYRPDLPLALDGFTLHIASGERLAVVGRTGAGKSTILSTLFRLTELSAGRILLDGVDIATLGLHTLRAHLAIIPQDPTLFRGTVRSNLDPLEASTDDHLLAALTRVHLAPGLALDSPVDDEGGNLSVGQRQLLALARALLRTDARVFLVDEATSAVDGATDQHVQQVLLGLGGRASGSESKTVVAIAHRLRTVLAYDRVCVVDDKRVAEIGPPRELWEAGGLFRAMCDRASISEGDFDSSRS
ncbi:ATP-binding cassette subfamily C (CFTR/MRP) member 1 [Microdochium nivale]|nr:ATP-binding cassette subfamily C (CFTR/MRP) member 1 [Microdochium nivale]